MRPKVSYTLFTFCVTASLTHTALALNALLHTPSSRAAYISVPKQLNCIQLSGVKMPVGTRLRLTIHGVVAGRGVLGEAAAYGEAMWLGHGAGSAGETLFAAKVAL